MQGQNLFCPVLLWTEKAKNLYARFDEPQESKTVLVVHCPDCAIFCPHNRASARLIRTGGKRKDAASASSAEPSGLGDDMAMVATEVVRLKQEQRAIEDRVCGAACWRRSAGPSRCSPSSSRSTARPRQAAPPRWRRRRTRQRVHLRRRRRAARLGGRLEACQTAARQ